MFTLPHLFIIISLAALLERLSLANIELNSESKNCCKDMEVK